MAKARLGGKHKRYGKNKVKCARYYNEGRLGKNKLVRFIKNNIGKNWTEDLKNKAILEFEALHRSKHNTNELIG